MTVALGAERQHKRRDLSRPQSATICLTEKERVELLNCDSARKRKAVHLRETVRCRSTRKIVRLTVQRRESHMVSTLRSSCLLLIFVTGMLFTTTGSVLAAKRKPLSIVLMGQSMLQSDMRVNAPEAVEEIKPLLNGDVIFTNFEATIANKGEEPSSEQAMARVLLFAPPSVFDAMTELGVNLLSLANNHVYDLGQTGLLNALREVKARKISFAGIGANLDEASSFGYLHTSHGTVALIAMASGYIQPDAIGGKAKAGINEIRMEGVQPHDAGHPNLEDTQRNLQSIRSAAQKADLVIAYQHNHAYDEDAIAMMREELPMRLVPPEWIKKWARDEVDAGADIVVMHGQPLLQGVEIYRGKPIFYDLGNFIFQLPLSVDFFEPITFESVVVRVEFERKTLRSITFRPIVLNNRGRGEGALAVSTRGLPLPAPPERAGYILQRLVELCKPFGTVVEVNGDTAAARLDEAHSNRSSAVPSPIEK
jgi:poly-gamma-glutamate capsule biosynthesis protein CapA/YwtB (metallophosphatase superfamily)